MGRNFKFQVQDSFLEYFFWRFEKRIALSEKKPPLKKVFIDKFNDLFPHIFSEVTTSPTLWAGTNSGQVLAFVLTFSKNEEKRKEDKVEVIFVQYFCKNSFNSSLIEFSKHLKNYVHTTYFQL